MKSAETSPSLAVNGLAIRTLQGVPGRGVRPDFPVPVLSELFELRR